MQERGVDFVERTSFILYFRLRTDMFFYPFYGLIDTRKCTITTVYLMFLRMARMNSFFLAKINIGIERRAPNELDFAL